MTTFAGRLQVLQAESERIKHYLHALPAAALTQSSASGRLEVESDTDLALAFGQWFRGI